MSVVKPELVVRRVKSRKIQTANILIGECFLFMCSVHIVYNVLTSLFELHYQMVAITLYFSLITFYTLQYIPILSTSFWLTIIFKLLIEPISPITINDVCYSADRIYLWSMGKKK